MAGRKAAPKAEAPTPAGASAEGPAAEEPAAEPAPEPEPKPVPKPVPPHPVKRYRVAPAAHLGTRVGGHVLTERGWVRDTSTEQEK